MPWAALDDAFHEDPRVLEAGLAAAGLYACASTYAARHLTDGYVSQKAVARMLENGDSAPLSALLRVGLMMEVHDGYDVVDYLKANPTREKVEKLRRDKTERARKAARARWEKERERRGETDPSERFEW
jgi:hypothetical protein